MSGEAIRTGFHLAALGEGRTDGLIDSLRASLKDALRRAARAEHRVRVLTTGFPTDHEIRTWHDGTTCQRPAAGERCGAPTSYLIRFRISSREVERRLCDDHGRAFAEFWHLTL